MKVRAISESQFVAIAELVRARTGLALGESRRQQAESGIRQAMAETGVSDPNRFIQLLKTTDHALQALIEHLTVAETYFFREREQFEVLRRTILPELARREGRLRLWSAGCASGEEPYSLAMLLDREGLAERSSIVGTDISRVALALARKASYGPWSFRDNHPDATKPYFESHGERLVLSERIRRLVEFDVVNLASDIYPARIVGPCGFDVILCRNVLIYFDQQSVEQVARRMFASLKEGGWLITGPSDPPLWQHAPFETVLTTAGVLYRRVGNAAAVSRKEVATPRPMPPRHQVEALNSIAAPAALSPAAPVGPAVAGSHCARESAEGSKHSPHMLATCMSELTTLANLGDHDRTGAAIAAALAVHPMAPEIHYLHAIVLMGRDRYEEASSSLRRALYLDRSMAVAHFALGSILERRGAFVEARRSYHNVLAVCDQRCADEIVPLSDGERTGRLMDAARAHLACIHDGIGRRP